MPGKDQASVTIPLVTYEEVKRLVSEFPEMFENPTDFVRAALRDYIKGMRSGPQPRSVEKD